MLLIGTYNTPPMFSRTPVQNAVYRLQMPINTVFIRTVNIFKCTDQNSQKRCLQATEAEMYGCTYQLRGIGRLS